MNDIGKETDFIKNKLVTTRQSADFVATVVSFLTKLNYSIVEAHAIAYTVWNIHSWTISPSRMLIETANKAVELYEELKDEYYNSR